MEPLPWNSSPWVLFILYSHTSWCRKCFHNALDSCEWSKLATDKLTDWHTDWLLNPCCACAHGITIRVCTISVHMHYINSEFYLSDLSFSSGCLLTASMYLPYETPPSLMLSSITTMASRSWHVSSSRVKRRCNMPRVTCSHAGRHTCALKIVIVYKHTYIYWTLTCENQYVFTIIWEIGNSLKNGSCITLWKFFTCL